MALIEPDSYVLPQTSRDIPDTDIVSYPRVVVYIYVDKCALFTHKKGRSWRPLLEAEVVKLFSSTKVDPTET